MKRTLLILITLTFIFSFIPRSWASFWSDLMNSGDVQVPFCKDDNECSLEVGKNELINQVEILQTDKDISTQISDIVSRVLTYTALIAVILIIYGGFLILTSGGEDDKISSGKKYILYTCIGIILIYLAGAIVNFVINNIIS